MDTLELVRSIRIANLDIEVQSLNIEDNIDRLNAYCILGFTEKAFDDAFCVIRLVAYRNLGWTEKAFEDNADIRLEAYQNLGWTAKALDDVESTIRIEAYRVLGFTKHALHDRNKDIREEATEWLELKSRPKSELKSRIMIEMLNRL